MPKKTPKDDYSELVSYLDERFSGIDKRLDGLKGDFRDLQTSVDTYAKKADAYFQEMLMLAHKVDRHERWIMQLAEKLNVPLKP